MQSSARNCIYLHSCTMFQVGVRRNNTKVMMAGRLKFAPLFYGLNRYNYQQIEILDSMMRLSAPPVSPLLILLAGFFYQLPPVKTSSLYRDISLVMPNMWNQVFKITTLTEIMRQKTIKNLHFY